MDVCIQECKPTSFTPVTSVAAQTYTIFDTTLSFSTTTFTQTPACGYSTSYGATIEKTVSPTLISDAIYPADDISTVGYVVLNPGTDSPLVASVFDVVSSSTNEAGTYVLTLIATLVETKWNQALNTNTATTITLTIVDPCATAVVNPASNARIVSNMPNGSVLGTAQS